MALVLSQAELDVIRSYVREEVEAALARKAGQLHSDGTEIDQAIFDGTNRLKAVSIAGMYVELGRLIRILENSSMHASFIYDYLRKDNATPPEDLRDRNALMTQRHSCMRKAVTMRDSLEQIALLLKGVDLDKYSEEEEPDGP